MPQQAIVFLFTNYNEYVQEVATQTGHLDMEDLAAGSNEVKESKRKDLKKTYLRVFVQNKKQNNLQPKTFNKFLCNRSPSRLRWFVERMRTRRPR